MSIILIFWLSAITLYLIISSKPKVTREPLLEFKEVETLPIEKNDVSLPSINALNKLNLPIHNLVPRHQRCCPICGVNVDIETSLIKEPFMYIRYLCRTGNGNIGCGYEWATDVPDSAKEAKNFQNFYIALENKVSSLEEEKNNMEKRLITYERPLLQEANNYREFPKTIGLELEAREKQTHEAT